MTWKMTLKACVQNNRLKSHTETRRRHLGCQVLQLIDQGQGRSLGSLFLMSSPEQWHAKLWTVHGGSSLVAVTNFDHGTIFDIVEIIEPSPKMATNRCLGLIGQELPHVEYILVFDKCSEVGESPVRLSTTSEPCNTFRS